MNVEFNVRDFLDRAEAAYPERIALVDEPDQPARPWSPSPSLGWPLGPGHRPPGSTGWDRSRRTGGRRVPQLRPAADVVLRRVRVGAHPGAHQLPAGQRPRSSSSSSTPGRRSSCTTPSSTRPWPGSARTAGFVLGRRQRRRALRPRQPNRRPGRPTRSATATINYTSGTTARPKGVQLTHRNCWVNAAVFGWHVGRVRPRRATCTPCRCSTANGWGMPCGDGRHGRAPRSCCARSTARRSCGGSTATASPCCAPRRRWSTPSSTPPPTRDGRRPGRGTDPHRGRRGAAAEPDHRAGRVGAGLGVHPDLRADRDVARC